MSSPSDHGLLKTFEAILKDDPIFLPQEIDKVMVRVHISDYVQADFEYTLRECLEKLVICGTSLIRNKDLKKLQKKWGVYEVEHADLYNLINYEFMQDIPEWLWDWFSKESKSRRERREKTAALA